MTRPDQTPASPTHRLVRDGAIVVAANLLFALAAFALTILTARRLGPAAFGEWGALWSLMMVTAALFPSVSMFAAREVSRELAGGRNAGARASILRIGAAALAVGLPLTLLMHTQSPSIARALRIGTSTHVALVAWFFLASWLLAFVRGALEGAQRFGALAVNLVFEGAARFGAGFAALFAGLSIGGLLGAYIAAAGVALALALGEWRRPLPDAVPVGAGPGVGWSFFGPVLATHALIVVITNADMLLVKRYFPPESAGWFSVCFTGGKLIYFFAEGIGTAMFPKAVTLRESGRSARPILAAALAMFAIGAAVSFAAVLSAPRFFVTRVFGPDFDQARHILTPYLFYSALMSGAVLVAKYRLAEGNYGFLGVLALGTAGLVGGIALYHPSLNTVTTLLVLVAAIVLFFLLLAIVQESRNPSALKPEPRP